MQLVEQGKLDLDADVNKYLDFKIPPYDGKPVTLRNIMTHTAGFEEQVKDLITIDAGDVHPARRSCLKHWIPTRIYAAGHDAGLFELRDRARRLHRRSASRASRSTTTSSATSSRRSGMKHSTLPPAAAGERSSR